MNINKTVKLTLASFLILCGSAYALNSDILGDTDTDHSTSVGQEFSLQKFLNNIDTLNYMYSKNMENLNLFIAQRSDQQVFTDYDLNQADQFYAINSTKEKGIKYTRDLSTLRETKSRWLNFSYPYYSMSTFPIQTALNRVKTKCDVKNQGLDLARFGANLPAVKHPTIMYIFTFKDQYGRCVDATFDTFSKKIACSASETACFFDDDYLQNPELLASTK